MTTAPPRRVSTITRRLARLTVLSSGAALLTSTLAFGVYDRYVYREAMGRRLAWQAEIVATNVASALAFDDPVAASVTVGALQVVPSTLSAAVYRQDGTRFAEYHRDGSPSASASTALDVDPAAPPRLVGGRLAITRPVIVHDNPIGMVAIQADLGELTARGWDYATISAVIFVASLGVALMLAWRWQRDISGPMFDLAGVAAAIAEDQDYSRRAETRTSIAEIDALATSFNAMVDQIQMRDRSLREAHDELEERVRARTTELQTVNQELEAFSYSVSHDLRAPLRHVSGFAELLEEHAGPSLDDQGRKYIATINKSARRMATLIDDLLAFSRISRASLNRRRVSLTTAVETARKDVMADPSVAGRRVVWSVGALPDVDADPAMLHQVLVNLFANALKYSSTREETRIVVEPVDAGPGEAALAVRDNGVGFDMQYAHKLFGVFQRLHRANEFDGTGIGLANVKRIVTRHGGRVWAEGVVNEGASFYVALPLATEEPA